MKTLNGKTEEQMTEAEWTAVEMSRDGERLRERLRSQIESCRDRLDEAERRLSETEYRFPHSGGVLGYAGVELDILAGQYANVQHQAACLVSAVEEDHRRANPQPGEGVVCFLKFVRREMGLPPLPYAVGQLVRHRRTGESFEVAGVAPPESDTTSGDLWLRRPGALSRRNRPFAAESTDYEAASQESIPLSETRA